MDDLIGGRISITGLVIDVSRPSLGLVVEAVLAVSKAATLAETETDLPSLFDDVVWRPR